MNPLFVSTVLLLVVISGLLATVFAGQFVKVGFPLPPEEKRLGCVDGLRGYLSLFVVAHHFIIWTMVTRLGMEWGEPQINLFNQFGAGAVALFFMTTGFVFYPRILKGFAKCNWLAVYISRVFRLVPLIVFSFVVITSIIILRTGNLPDASFIKPAILWISTWWQPPLLSYPDSGRLNAYVLWSLKQEWLFYIFILPACAFAMDRIRGRLPSYCVPLALMLLSFALQAFGIVSLEVFGVSFGVILYLPLFAVGMIAYEIQSSKKLAAVLSTPLAGAIALVSLIVGAVAFHVPYTFALPFFAVFFISVASGNSLFGLLRTHGALVLGECSYGNYLLHGTLLSLLFVEGAGMLSYLPTSTLFMALPFVVIALGLVTPVTFLAIERPAISMGRTLSRKLTRAQPQSASQDLKKA